MALDPAWSRIPLARKMARWRIHVAGTVARAARRALEAAMKREHPLPSALGQLALRCALLERRAAGLRHNATTSLELERWTTAAEAQLERRRAGGQPLNVEAHV